MSHDLPLFALQRLDSGVWLVRTPVVADPHEPAVVIVEAIDIELVRIGRSARLDLFCA